MTGLAQGDATVLVPAPEGAPTMRVVYFFSGKKRKGSIADYLQRLCRHYGCGLLFEEVDIMVGGSEHDLLDRPSQQAYLTRMEQGLFDLAIFSPPLWDVEQGKLAGRRAQAVPQPPAPLGPPG